MGGSLACRGRENPYCEGRRRRGRGEKNNFSPVRMWGRGRFCKKGNRGERYVVHIREKESGGKSLAQIRRTLVQTDPRVCYSTLFAMIIINAFVPILPETRVCVCWRLFYHWLAAMLSHPPLLPSSFKQGGTKRRKQVGGGGGPFHVQRRERTAAEMSFLLLV